ncbi:energy-coupling factor transporter transmembrane component T family protein [Facklamia lactis]|uniref:energy-coupling factor transporter transmembrane component T family protein n=1 Tax=Facklamia lactis TaxID=2749967 RepID=UPI0018CCF765|nr:CbiQ family ECF transporter T component [Facklamia lactis]MBG9979515.1 hypothetical protein [Facklamia lactis]
MGENIVQWHKPSQQHGMMTMEVLSYQSKLRRIHPTIKVIFALVMLVLVIGSKQLTVSGLVLVSVLLFMTLYHKLPYQKIRTLFTAPLTFILMSTIGLMIAISTSSQPNALRIGAFYLSINHPSQEQALNLAMVSISSVALLLHYAISTPIGDVIFSLKQLHVPKVVIEIMYFIYRYIITLSIQLDHLQRSSKSRLGFINQKRTLRSSLWIASQLFRQSLKLSLESFDAMESRMYQGELNFIERSFEVKHHVITHVLLVLLVWVVHYLGGV